MLAYRSFRVRSSPSPQRLVTELGDIFHGLEHAVMVRFVVGRVPLHPKFPKSTYAVMVPKEYTFEGRIYGGGTPPHSGEHHHEM